MMLIQSTHSFTARGVDAYMSPPEAAIALMAIEPLLPTKIWEPACGDGALVLPLKKDGYSVVSSDIIKYESSNFSLDFVADYLVAEVPDSLLLTIPRFGIVTNPPYILAERFARKAVGEAPYVALLLRTNWLESMSRLSFFREQPPSRVWVSSRRLPMMHRYGWNGPRAPSNTCHAWFVWDKMEKDHETTLHWFDWKDYV